MSVRFEQISVLPWDINKTYEIGTKVVHNNKKYVSKRNVPKGVNIGMGDYWKKLELSSDVEELAETVEAQGTEITTLKTNLTATVGEDAVPFKFAYDSENDVYGFIVGNVFHAFYGDEYAVPD